MEQTSAPFPVAPGNVRVISNRLNTELELPWMAFQRCLYVLFDTGPAHNHENLPPSDAARDHVTVPQHMPGLAPLSTGSLTYSQHPARKKQLNLQVGKRPERSSKYEPSPQAPLVGPLVGVRPASEALAKSTTDAITCPITKVTAHTQQAI